MAAPVSVSQINPLPLALIVAPTWEEGRALRGRLANQGIDAFVVLSLSDAVRLLDILVCDLVLVDVSHFGQAGIELMQWVREVSDEVCLVALGSRRIPEVVGLDAGLPANPEVAALAFALSELLKHRHDFRQSTGRAVA